MIIHNPILTGSFTVNGTDVSSITSSAASLTSLNSYTASQNNRNGTYATTGSNTFAGIQTVNSNLIVTGSITAQTLVVQTVTSSVVYSSGSNVFGNNIANTHVFTGSMLVTGSSTFSGSITATNLVASSTYNGDPVLASFTNASTGSAAEAAIYIKNGATTNDATFIETTGTNFTTTYGFVQDGGVIGTGTDLSGGLSLMVRANADMRFYTNGHTNERMRITSGGLVGIGNTPSAWSSIWKPIQLGSFGGYITGRTDNNSLWLGSNNYNNGTSFVYTTTGPATNMYFGDAGEIVFRNVASGTAGNTFSFTERMRINGSGIITMPSQVSFKGYITTNIEVSKSTWVTIPYNGEEYDTQSNFSTSTYKFTAPVAGKYLFTVNFNAYSLDDTAKLNVALVVNSTSYYYIFIMPNLPTGNTGDVLISGAQIFNLSASDTVDVRVYTDGSGLYGLSQTTSYNSFSGHLLG